MKKIARKKRQEGGTAYIKNITRVKTSRRAVKEIPTPSEMLSKSIMEQSPFSIQIFSSDGVCIQANRAWEKMWQSGLEDVLKYNVLKDRQLVKMGMMPFIKKAFSGETVKLPPF